MDIKTDKIDWDKAKKIFESDYDYFRKIHEKSPKHSIDPRTKDILIILAAGALVGLTIAFPAFPMAISPFFVYGNKYKKFRLNQIINRMSKRKLVKIKEIEGQKVVEITEKGKIRALCYKMEDLKINKPVRWDKKWRIVIFDIPEKYKRIRDLFRMNLKLMGFYNLQESVLVHPYSCFNQI